MNLDDLSEQAARAFRRTIGQRDPLAPETCGQGGQDDDYETPDYESSDDTSSQNHEHEDGDDGHHSSRP